MPKLQFIVFLAVVLCVYAAMHVFVYWRVATGLSVAPGQRLALKWGLAAAALLFFAGEVLSRLHWTRAVLCIGSIWLGILSIALAVFLLETVLSLLLPQGRRIAVLAGLALVLLAGVFSLVNAALGPAVLEKAVALRNLPPELDGFAIVHLSDLHAGNLTSMTKLRRIVAKTNALEPDLICVTGDTLDGEVGRDGKYCAVLGGLRARHGVVAVTGNHEFYAGIDKFEELARCSHWRLLRNQSWVAGGLAIAGLEDETAARMQRPGPDLDRALAGLPPGLPIVLLYHQPKLFAEAARRGVVLQLSGHTHAGQLPPMDLIVYLTYRYPAGLYRLGEAFIHTSPGTSTWGPPMRFLSRSQIVKIILKTAKNE